MRYAGRVDRLLCSPTLSMSVTVSETTAEMKEIEGFDIAERDLKAPARIKEKGPGRIG